MHRIRKRRGAVPRARPVRRHLPVERHSITHKFAVAGHEGYLTIGMYEDGTPGEIFIVMAKEGSTLSGVMDSFATTCSMALQYGVPLKVLVDKFSHTRFEPSGFTSNPQVPYAKSIMDYIFRYLASKFLPAEEAKALGVQIEQPALTPLKVQTPPACDGLDFTAEERRPRRYRRSRRPGLLRVRLVDGAQRRLLQVPELRLDERLFVNT